MKMRRLGGYFVISLLLTSTVLADGRQILHGHVPAITHQLPLLGEYSGTNRLHLAVSLPLRNQAALSDLLAKIYNPASPAYRHYLTPEQFAVKFGPSEQDYQAVVAFANANGLQVTKTWSNRVLVDVEGSAADIGRALHTTFKVYRHPTENRTFYAPATEPSLDLSVPILHISGLDNYESPRPHGAIRPLVKGQVLANGGSGSGPGGAYIGGDFRAAYVPDTTLDGSGQSVGLLEYNGFSSNDIIYYENVAGLANIPLQKVLVDGAPGTTTGHDDFEVALDIEMAISMATNLSQVVVYIAQPGAPFEDILNEMAASNQVKQFSCSWYIYNGSSQPAADQIWQQMAAQGQSFFNASGDDDGYTGLIWFPADSPYITQVGGTTLTTTGPGGAWMSETTWNFGWAGSAGGISTQYPIPYWQTNISMAANGGSTTMRNMPDVAMVANNIYVRVDGGDNNGWGTSFSAPLWAGFAALVNQQTAAMGNPPIGFINAAADAISTGPDYSSDFHDITTGDNNVFSAVTGYDLCTGWGTPVGQDLINDLANTTSIPPPLMIVPSSGTLNISWPTNWTGYVLLTTTDLASGNWVPVTNSPLQYSNLYVVPITPTGTNAFFRLQPIGY